MNENLKYLHLCNKMGFARYMAIAYMLGDVSIKHVLEVYYRVITQEDTYQWLLSRSCAVHMRRQSYLSRMRCVATRQLGRGLPAGLAYKSHQTPTRWGPE